MYNRWHDKKGMDEQVKEGKISTEIIFHQSFYCTG